MIIVGDKELENGTVSVRKRKEGDTGVMKANEFLNLLKEEIDQKK